MRIVRRRDVVISAANMGGDSDTIAAIAGGLEVGCSQLPKRWVDMIVCAEELEELAVQLADVRSSFDSGFVLGSNQG
ncbi:ADP-ribosylglycohydrolase family protein [Geobacillus kaustophilus]|uniref:ADP-ribosylglycohydrolase family protein n=1 Tax=Geobacillus kaustophilus TaxID=1462 RepID=A0A0D8BTL8_GEOKU|nr:ADP-ribosylglycohydrolase family protein [Geobacillus kaustophilus]KJE27531.1 ADP-ribosylglycohydrolase family protein [Geobacillus kaustophilus]